MLFCIPTALMRYLHLSPSSRADNTSRFFLSEVASVVLVSHGGYQETDFRPMIYIQSFGHTSKLNSYHSVSHILFTLWESALYVLLVSMLTPYLAVSLLELFKKPFLTPFLVGLGSCMCYPLCYVLSM